MNTEMTAKCKQIADHYGMTAQRGMVIEECSELIKAICKWQRTENTDPEKESKAISDMLEEFADVEIMLEQMKHLLTPEMLTEWQANIPVKLNRQLERIAGEKEQYERWRKGVTASTQIETPKERK